MGGQLFPPFPGSQLQGTVVDSFYPKRREISAITNAENAEVTTTENHGYSTGMWVRLFVPYGYGMRLFDVAQITVTSDTTLTVDFDTLDMDAFAETAAAKTPAQVIPISGPVSNIA